MAIIDQYRSLLTVLSEYEVTPDECDRLAQEMTSFFKGRVKGEVGFISANLHTTLDKKKIVNYAQWKSEEDYQKYLANGDLQNEAKFFSSKLGNESLLKVVFAS